MKLNLNITVFSVACLSLLVSCVSQNTRVASIQMNIPDHYKVGEFVVGTQAYTFRMFTVFEAIEKTSAAGGRVIEFYPGQQLSPELSIEFRDMSDDHIELLHAKLDEHDIKMVNYGVIGLTDPEQAREVFEFAQKLGVSAITSNPDSHEKLDFIEPLIKEFDIMLGIHNHRKPDDGRYHHWDPEHIANIITGRDHRIGVCADTGHWIRSGINPVEALRLLEGRIISLHLKDVDRYHTEGYDVLYGTGIGNISGILHELKRQNFGGHISVEYEYNWHDNVPDVAFNIGFIKGWSANKK